MEMSKSNHMLRNSVHSCAPSSKRCSENKVTTFCKVEPVDANVKSPASKKESGTSMEERESTLTSRRNFSLEFGAADENSESESMV